MTRDNSPKKGFISRVLIIPSVVFLSVVFGGAYGSGREVVSFVSVSGPFGGLSAIATIAIFYAAVLFTCFELARLYRVYEYSGLARVLLKRFWPAYEVLVQLGLVVALAICASAAGAIAHSHFSLSPLFGSAVLLVIIVVLNFFGRAVVEQSMLVSVCALSLALAYLLFSVLGHSASEILIVFDTAENSMSGSIKHGLTYAQTVGGFVPILLYCAVQLQTRLEVAAAAACAAMIAVIPALVLHIVFMASYPDILSETVPAYQIVESLSTPLFLSLYVFIVFIMIAQTGVGLLHGVLERIDKSVVLHRNLPLSNLESSAVAAGAFVLALAFASAGLVNLILGAFTFFSYSFMLVFFLPLFTYGAWLISRNSDPIKLDDEDRIGEGDPL